MAKIRATIEDKETCRLEVLYHGHEWHELDITQTSVPPALVIECMNSPGTPYPWGDSAAKETLNKR